MQILEVRFRIRDIPGLTEHCKVGLVWSLDCDESKWDAHYKKKKKRTVTAHNLVTYCNIFKSTASIYVSEKRSTGRGGLQHSPYIAANAPHLY